MKYFFLIILFVISLTDAVEVTDEDINSPLVSYLLAKVQRLEARMMAKPSNARSIREVEKRSIDTNTSADDKRAKDCPQQVVTYIRWGNKTCPYGANTIYKGVAIGGRYDLKGSPSNMLCSPHDAMRYPKYQGGNQRAYGVEYRVSGDHNHANCRNMPCTLCEATRRSDKIMIPSHYVCPDGWHKEYNGYIMAGSNSQEGSSMYYCIDKAMEQIESSGSCDNVHHFYTVYSYAINNSGAYELPCVVCTK